MEQGGLIAFAIVFIVCVLCIWKLPSMFGAGGWNLMQKILLTIASGVITWFIVEWQSNK